MAKNGVLCRNASSNMAKNLCPVGGCNMSRLDGSVQFVSETVETEVLFALASAAARESNTERD